MTTFEWRPFDYDNRQDTAPPKHDELVWIHEEHYHGVTFGYYDHGGWWCTYWGSDDCHVTHWAPIEYPDAPEVPEEEEEDDEETGDDLDAIRAALDPDDQAGHDLIDFDRYPEATLNGIPLTREQRIDGAAMRPAWKVLMREMAASISEIDKQMLGIDPP